MGDDKKVLIPAMSGAKDFIEGPPLFHAHRVKSVDSIIDETFCET